ncbi:MAG: glycosyltransferase family 2 protein [Bacteroidales bacterium]|nr:glycosyltransferase family 2 protein [Bacteroidales bacterium]
MQNNPKCSVVIPSYNSAKTIEFTLKHLFSQSASDRILEVIVVDSSDDGVTPALLEKYASENKIVHINSGTRVMPAIQRNIGAKNAKGDLLLLLIRMLFHQKTGQKQFLNITRMDGLPEAGAMQYLNSRKRIIWYMGNITLSSANSLPEVNHALKTFVLPAIFCRQTIVF